MPGWKVILCFFIVVQVSKFFWMCVCLTYAASAEAAVLQEIFWSNLSVWIMQPNIKLLEPTCIWCFAVCQQPRVSQALSKFPNHYFCWGKVIWTGWPWTPSRLTLAPSMLTLDPRRLTLDPSRLTLDPSRLTLDPQLNKVFLFQSHLNQSAPNVNNDLERKTFACSLPFEFWSTCWILPVVLG